MLQDNSDISEVHLKNFHPGYIGATDIAGVLRFNKNLCTLYIRDYCVRNKGAVSFASALRKNVTLRSLRLSRISINRKGAMAIAATLRYYNHTIGAVIFESTGIEDIYVSIQACNDINYNYSAMEADVRKTGMFP